MALDDRMKDADDPLRGTAKETAGAAGDEELRAEGRGDQARGEQRGFFEDTVEDVKNKAEEIINDLRQRFDKK